MNCMKMLIYSFFYEKHVPANVVPDSDPGSRQNIKFHVIKNVKSQPRTMFAINFFDAFSAWIPAFSGTTLTSSNFL